MNSFVVEILDDQAEMCTFYTVRWDDSKESETEKFASKYSQDEAYSEATTTLLNFVFNVVGNQYGAIDRLFNRFENEVVGLPVQGKVTLHDVTIHHPDFPLRLYALKITEYLVVLFNGGVKDASTNQESSLNLQWREACQFAKKILEDIRDGTIIINHKEWTLENYNGNSEIILFL